mgnify:CR=1 FL=1
MNQIFLDNYLDSALNEKATQRFRGAAYWYI